MISSKYLTTKPESVTLEQAVCPSCKTNEHQTHFFDAEDNINNLDGLYGVDLCSNCGLYITNPRPTENTIGYYYPETYAPYQTTQVGQANNSKLAKTYSIAQKILNTKQMYLPKVQPGKLLEIGCASGSFLHQMKVAGWDVKGLEFSESAVSKAVDSGLSVKQGSVLNHEDTSDGYDLIAAWMVLEHIHDPVQALEKIYSWVRPGGKFVFSVPNSNSFDFKKLKHNGYSLHIPNHLYHFTPAVIKDLLEQQGFKNIKIHHQVTMQSIIPSVGYFLKEKGIVPKLSELLIRFSRTSKLVRLIFHPLAMLFAMFGQTGRMTVWAEK